MGDIPTLLRTNATILRWLSEGYYNDRGPLVVGAAVICFWTKRELASCQPRRGSNTENTKKLRKDRAKEVPYLKIDFEGGGTRAIVWTDAFHYFVWPHDTISSSRNTSNPASSTGPGRQPLCEDGETLFPFDYSRPCRRSTHGLRFDFGFSRVRLVLGVECVWPFLKVAIVEGPRRRLGSLNAWSVTAVRSTWFRSLEQGCVCSDWCDLRPVFLCTSFVFRRCFRNNLHPPLPPPLTPGILLAIWSAFNRTKTCRVFRYGTFPQKQNIAELGTSNAEVPRWIACKPINLTADPIHGFFEFLHRSRHTAR